ncbi:MAG: class I SAM-dependent methyltransferase [Dehalococcoidia bacterium]
MTRVFNEREDMRLGKFEFLAMNNPLRRWHQKHVELKIFKDLLKKARIELNGKVIMDGGCGSGYSTGLIASEFHPSRIVAFDFMPEQIALAKKRNLQVDFAVGDLTKIDAADGTFDAVFIFGVLHHIPEWTEALLQISRVLKLGGILLVEEPSYRFDWDGFESGIKHAGFEIIDMTRYSVWDFHFYLCRKTG